MELKNYKFHGFISVFSENGAFVKRIGEGNLSLPHGVAVNNNNLYVTETDAGFINFGSVLLFQLPEGRLVKKVGTQFRNKYNFENPRQLTVCTTGDVYVTDRSDYGRIAIMDGKLNYQFDIKHSTISYPSDVNIFAESLFVLCESDKLDHSIHMFTLKGEYLTSIISRKDLRGTYFSTYRYYR